jgi:putative copper export protein
VSPITLDTFRIFLHVIAATVWVGGQLTLAGLVPALRALGPDAPKAVARRFNRIAWPAFGLLLVTGVWNLVEIDVGDRSTEYQVTLFVKLCVVAASGISAFLHTQAKTRTGLAVWGAVGGVATIAALFFGVVLRMSA